MVTRLSPRVLLSVCAVVAGALLTPVLARTVQEANAEQIKQARDTRKCPGCDLSYANLSGANLQLGDFANALFDHANLYRADFRGADLTGASLASANAEGANFQNARGVNLSGATTDERTVCPNGSAGPCN